MGLREFFFGKAREVPALVAGSEPELAKAANVPSSAPPPPGVAEAKPTDTVGTSGTAVFGGYVVSSEKRADLVGQRKYITFGEDILNVPIIGAAVRYFVALACRAGWTVEPVKIGTADPTPEAIKAAELVDHAINHMASPWRSVVQRMVMHRYLGFAICEWTAKRNADGSIGLADVEVRPQFTIERWDVDASGTVLGVWQRSPQTSQQYYIPRSKFMYLADQTLTDSPEGVGLMRHVVEQARKLRRLEQLEGIGYETDLRGVPVVSAPFRKMQDDVAANVPGAQARLADVTAGIDSFAEHHVRGAASCLKLDSMPYQNPDRTLSNVPQFKAELLKGTGTASGDVNTAIVRLIHDIARVLGGEHLLLGADGKGSLALSKNKAEALALQVDGANGAVADCARNDLGRPIVMLNGMDPDLAPTFKPDATQYRDVEQLASVFRDMATAAFQPDDPIINWMRDLVNAPHAPEVDMEALIAEQVAAQTAQQDPEGALPGRAGDKEPGDKPVEPAKKPATKKRAAYAKALALAFSLLGEG